MEHLRKSQKKSEYSQSDNDQDGPKFLVSSQKYVSRDLGFQIRIKKQKYVRFRYRNGFTFFLFATISGTQSPGT